MELSRSAFILVRALPLALWLGAIDLPALPLMHFNHVLAEDPSSSEAQAYCQIVHKLGLLGFWGCYAIYMAAIWIALFFLRKSILDKFHGPSSSNKKTSANEQQKPFPS
jgi:hypothetical protein